MIKYIKLLFALVAFSISLNATETPFSFLRYNSSARASALAGAFVTMKNDPSAVFYNPATIYTVDEKFLSTTFLKHVLDINSGNVSYVYNKLENGVVAANIAYTNYGSFVRRDINGNVLPGEFSGSNLSLGVTYANELDSNFYYGVTGKVIYLKLEEQSSMALAVDAGLFYKLKDGRTNLGVSVLNVGTQVSKLGNVSDKLPLDIRLGINHRLRGLPLLVNFNFHHLGDNSGNFFEKFKSFSMGGEVYLGKFLMARVGYDNNIRTNISPETSKGLSGISLGAGIKMKDINLDYSFSQYGASAILHRISANLDF